MRCNNRDGASHRSSVRSNPQLLVLLKTIKHNLDMIMPPALPNQAAYLLNAKASTDHAIRDVELRIKMNREGTR